MRQGAGIKYFIWEMILGIKSEVVEEVGVKGGKASKSCVIELLWDTGG